MTCRPGSRLRLIVRKGNPSRPSDLVKCNAGEASAIIVLNSMLRQRSGATDHTIDMPAIKALLSVSQVPGALRKNHAILGAPPSLMQPSLAVPWPLASDVACTCVFIVTHVISRARRA